MRSTILGSGSRIPPKHLAERWEEIQLYDWISGNYESMIENEAMSLQHGVGRNYDNDYITVPLASRLVKTDASLLAGQRPGIKWEDENNNTRGHDIIKNAGAFYKFRQLAEVASADGGVWAREYINTSTPRGRRGPLVSIHPETDVIAKIVNSDEVIEANYIQFREADSHLYHLIETHAASLEEGDNATITWALYESQKPSELGELIPLDSTLSDGTQPYISLIDLEHGEYDGFTYTYDTGTEDMWMQYLPNTLLAGNPYGISSLDGLISLLLALNEAVSSGHNGMKHAEPFLFADERLLDTNGRLDTDHKVIKVRVKDAMQGATPFLDAKSFAVDIPGFVAWQDNLLDLTLFLCGLDPDTMGRDTASGQGGIASGRALRLRNLRSLIEVTGKAEIWRSGYQRILTVLAQIDAQRGQTWVETDFVPSVELKLGWPEDSQDVSDEQIALHAAGLRSTEQAVRKIMTAEGASTDEIEAELLRISEEQGALSQTATSNFANVLNGIHPAAPTV